MVKTIVVFKIPGLAQFAVIKLRPFSKVIIFVSEPQNERRQLCFTFPTCRKGLCQNEKMFTVFSDLPKTTNTN